MRRSPYNKGSSRALLLALWLNAAALGLIALALLSRSSGQGLLPAAMAQNQAAIGGSAGAFIVPGQFSTNTYGCYIMDVDAQTMSAYQYYPADKQLRLIAARSFRYDRRLQSYNTSPPIEEVRVQYENDLRKAQEEMLRELRERQGAGSASQPAATQSSNPTTKG